MIDGVNHQREVLGDFSSIECFKAVVVGVEETLGVQAAGVALKAAGRKRGQALATSLGVAGRAMSASDAGTALRDALGPNGTRLCLVDEVVEADGVWRVYLSDTVCSAGEPEGSSRELSFTLGAVHGAMEAVTGRKLRARQVESILRGGRQDVVELQAL